MNSNLIQQVSNLIAEVAHEAIMPRFKQLKTGDIDQKTPDEVVTVADRDAEARLTPCLAGFIPGSRVVGEEACAADSSLLTKLDDGPVWLVDPLDGTSNFIDGHPPFSTMVALLVEGETRMAWISDPLSGQLATAELGNGAWVNGSRLEARAIVPKASEISGAILHRFLPPDLKASILKRAGGLGTALPGTKSAGAEYPAIALCQQHFALFWRTLAWDHAPGALILSEAGGKVARLDGEPYRPSSQASGLLAAHNPGIWNEVRRLLIAA